MTKQKQYGLRQTKIELAASFKHLSNYKNKIITRLKMLQKPQFQQVNHLHNRALAF